LSAFFILLFVTLTSNAQIVDIPDTKIFDLTFDGGIIFPNGIYVANSDNITAYTLYTSGYNSPNLTAGG
jgi:hypothetical protein